jgi:dolichol kinase
MPLSKVYKEILRKSVHITSVLIVLAHYVLGDGPVLAFLLLYLVCTLIMEELRLSYGTRIPIFDFLLRSKEKKVIGGYVYFVIGIIIALSLFSQNVAYAAILMTTFGDASAALVGRFMGKIKLPGGDKSLEGSLTEFFVDIIIGYIFIQQLPVVLFMAAFATLTEVFFKKVDDNMAIPIFAGAAGEGSLLLMSLIY